MLRQGNFSLGDSQPPPHTHTHHLKPNTAALQALGQLILALASSIAGPAAAMMPSLDFVAGQYSPDLVRWAEAGPPPLPALVPPAVKDHGMKHVQTRVSPH